MKNYRIAVLGSTGVVGREMIRLIEAGGSLYRWAARAAREAR